MERLTIYYYQYYFSTDHEVMVASGLLRAHMVSDSEFIERPSSVAVVSGTNSQQGSKITALSLVLFL